MNIRNFITLLIITACPSLLWANEEKPVQKEAAVEAPKKEGKSSRKKKATICAECGKPEAVCECGHADKAKATKHGPGDGHNH